MRCSWISSIPIVTNYCVVIITIIIIIIIIFFIFPLPVFSNNPINSLLESIFSHFWWYPAFRTLSTLLLTIRSIYFASKKINLNGCHVWGPCIVTVMTCKQSFNLNNETFQLVKVTITDCDVIFFQSFCNYLLLLFFSYDHSSFNSI